MSQHPTLTDQELAARNAYYERVAIARKRAGAVLREARIAKNLSRWDVAKAIDRSVNTIGCWESGQIPGPKIRDALCGLLGLDRAALDPAWDTPGWNEAPTDTDALSALRTALEQIVSLDWDDTPDPEWAINRIAADALAAVKGRTG